MKTQVLVLVFVLLNAAAFAQANQPHMMVGLLSSHFINQSSENRLSDADNPYGSGILVGYQLDQNFALALTGEYFKKDAEQMQGSEKMLRAHLSLIGFPVQAYGLRFYTSAGLVITDANHEKDGASTRMSELQGRFGIGVDYVLYGNLGLNLDAGLYTDGWNVKGCSNSIGLRYILPN